MDRRRRSRADVIRRRTGWLAAPLLASCSAPESERIPPSETLPELVRAVDLDPSPNIVEVRLIAQAGVVELEPGVRTSVLGYRDGGSPDAEVTVPGPLIEATVGDTLRVHFENALPGLATTVHWHGLRLPVDMDGNPVVSGAVSVGETFEYEFVLRDAGLFWYHPHVDTDVQLESGLQGVLLVREQDPPDVEHERILVLDDVALANDGSIDVGLEMDDAMLGRRGPVVTVNGAPPGVVASEAGAVERWRIVSTANGRYFDLALDGVSFRVIGWDGGLIPEPYDVEQLRVAPGERYDVLVVMPDDRDRIVLESRAIERGSDMEDAAVDLLNLELVGNAPRSDLPATERTIEPVTPTGPEPLSFVLTGKLEGPTAPVFFINEQRWPLNTPVEVASGDADVWEVVNDGDHHHPFHIHGLFFQVLDIDGKAPAALGWKDTVDIPAGATARLAVPYDEPGMWMFHCQIPEHAERGMMGDLLVTRP